MRYPLIGVLMLSAAMITAQAQTLCGVTKVGLSDRNAEEFTVTLDGKADAMVLVELPGKGLDLAAAAGAARVAARPAPTVSPKDGRVYINKGANRACVISTAKRGDKSYAYIEELEHVQGKPPKMRTEYVELN